jgi:hypothetical protein
MIILLALLALVAVVATVVLAFAYRDLRRARRARTRATVDQLRRWVNAMLWQYAPGATLLADANGGRGFLQLALTGREGEWRRVKFGLPDAEWSHENFALAAVALEEGADAAQVEENPGNVHVPRFLRIALEGERDEVAGRAAELLHRAAAVLELGPEQTFTVTVHGGDHPDFLRDTLEKIEQSALPRWFARRLTDHLHRQLATVESAGAGPPSGPARARQEKRPRGR